MCEVVDSVLALDVPVIVVVRVPMRILSPIHRGVMSLEPLVEAIVVVRGIVPQPVPRELEVVPVLG